MVVEYLEMGCIFVRVMSFSYLLLLTKVCLFLCSLKIHTGVMSMQWLMVLWKTKKILHKKDSASKLMRWVSPCQGLIFFCSKFDPAEPGQLSPQTKLLKLVCNPVRLRELAPSPEQWINLPSWSWSAAKSLRFCCNAWRMNCQCSAHLQMTSMPTYLIWSQFFLFFSKSQHRTSYLGIICISVGFPTDKLSECWKSVLNDETGMKGNPRKFAKWLSRQ